MKSNVNLSKDDAEFYLDMIGNNSKASVSKFYNIISNNTNDSYNRFIQVYNSKKDILTPREQQIVDFIYGINGKPKTLKEIGSLFKISPERVRQIKVNAHIKISRALKGHLYNKS